MEKSAFSSEAIFLIFSRFVSYASILIPGILLVRYLSKADYGTFSQSMLITQTISVCLMFGISKSIYYFVPGSNRKGEVLIRTLILLLAIGLAGSFGFVILRNSIAEFMNNPALSKLALIIAMQILFAVPNHATYAILLSVDKPRLLSALNLVSSCFFMVAIIGCILLRANIMLLLVAVLLYYLLPFLFIFSFSLNLLYHEGWRPMDFKSVLPQFRYSLPLGLTSLSLVFATELDKYVISNFYTPEQYAIYSRGAIRLPLVPILTYTIAYYLLPTLVKSFKESDLSEFKRIWHDSIVKIATIMMPAFIMLLLLSYDFITVLYTDRYSESVNVFRIYLFMLPLQLTGYDSILQATNSTRSVLYGSILGLSVNLLLSIVLVRKIGLMGPPLATVISMFLMVIFYLFQIKRRINVPITQVFPWKRLLVITGISALSGVVCFPLTRIYGSGIRTLILGGGSFSIVYFVLCLLSGVINTKTLVEHLLKSGLIPAQILNLLQRGGKSSGT